MKNDNVSERAAALINEAIVTLQRIENAPASPMNRFLPARSRREHRRYAARLRRGQVEPRYKNLHTAEQLADIYEQTARRDEILEQAFADLIRIGRDIRSVVEQEGSAAARTFNAMLAETEDAALFNGPDSEAAQRYRRMWFLISAGTRHEFESAGKSRTSP